MADTTSGESPITTVEQAEIAKKLEEARLAKEQWVKLQRENELKQDLAHRVMSVAWQGGIAAIGLMIAGYFFIARYNDFQKHETQLQKYETQIVRKKQELDEVTVKRDWAVLENEKRQLAEQKADLEFQTAQLQINLEDVRKREKQAREALKDALASLKEAEAAHEARVAELKGAAAKAQGDTDTAKVKAEELERLAAEKQRYEKRKREVETALKEQEQERKRRAAAPLRLPFEPETVRIGGGSFLMGSTPGETGRVARREGPVRKVSVPSFAIGKYEVTWGEWEACVAGGGCDDASVIYRGGDGDWGTGRRPVINVSLDDARAYAAWLSKKTGRSYRLPTEAEWEYAARSGTITRFPWGDEKPVCDEKAANGVNFGVCPERQTRPVGSFAANRFGLHDMHGNVWEWVQDCWYGTYRNAPIDGSARLASDGTSCRTHVIRGGSWSNFLPARLRSATRDKYNRTDGSNNLGFRVALTLTLPGN